MLTQQQLMLVFFILAAVVVIGIVVYNYGQKASKPKTCTKSTKPAVVPLESLPPLMASAAPPANPTPVEEENKLQEETVPELPPLPSVEQAPSSETVNEHRAELLRGTAKARARMSTPTTSALIMSSALTNRDGQGNRQNIGETAMMDRLHPSPSSEAVPW